MAVVLLSYTPAESTATVTAARIYSDPARTVLVTSGTPVLLSGVWNYSPDLADGDYYTEWDVTNSGGSFTDADDFLYVLHGDIADGTTVVGVHQVRTRLNKTSKADDAEIAEMIGAAVGYYSEVVGPIGRTSQRYYGGPFPRYASDVVLTDDLGNPVDANPYVGSPYLRWDEPAGIMGHGWYRSLTLTYTVALPAHHRETILADVAGYFSSTQRGNNSGALPTTGYENAYEDRATPLVLFPRIKQLGASLAGVA